MTVDWREGRVASVANYCLRSTLLPNFKRTSSIQDSRRFKSANRFPIEIPKPPIEIPKSIASLKSKNRLKIKKSKNQTSNL